MLETLLRGYDCSPRYVVNNCRMLVFYQAQLAVVESVSEVIYQYELVQPMD